MANKPIDASVINQHLLQVQYAEDAGKVFDRILPTFCVVVPAAMKKLQSAFDNQDVETVWRTAHELRGNSAAICAERMATLAQQVEESGRNGNWEMVALYIPALVHESGRVLDALQA